MLCGIAEEFLKIDWFTAHLVSMGDSRSRACNCSFNQPRIIHSIPEQRSSQVIFIMSLFANGDLVEAVDEFGVWAAAEVIEQQGEELTVRFDGFFSKWNRRVKSDEIRERTVHCFLTLTRTLTSLILSIFQSRHI